MNGHWRYLQHEQFCKPCWTHRDLAAKAKAATDASGAPPAFAKAPPPPPQRNGASSSHDGGPLLGAVLNRLNDIERQMTQSLVEARHILGEQRQIHQLTKDVLNQIEEVITQPQATPPALTTQPQGTPPTGLTTQPQAAPPGLTMMSIEAVEAADVALGDVPDEEADDAKEQ